MAITELIFPQVKTDKASIDEIEREWPSFEKMLTSPNPGLLSAFRGWVSTENEQDVRGEFKEILIFEWASELSFHAFVASQQFANFQSALRHLINGPPILQLYETNDSPKASAQASVVEIIRVNIDEDNVIKAQQVWETISQTWRGTTYGKSTNLEHGLLMGILGWTSHEERSTVYLSPEFCKALADLRAIGDVTTIIVDINPMGLAAPEGASDLGLDC